MRKSPINFYVRGQSDSQNTNELQSIKLETKD